ncbi:MAG: hypothetical protein II800_10445, partial [Lachnospiraceae bacterium]|nr:hypothetical protein [Lachnospiraceae bacterium]
KNHVHHSPPGYKAISRRIMPYLVSYHMENHRSNICPVRTIRKDNGIERLYIVSTLQQHTTQKTAATLDTFGFAAVSLF